MKIAIRFLAVIAVIQAALIAFTWSGKTDLKSHSGSSTLLTFSQTDVDAILIEDKENEILITKKDDNGYFPMAFPPMGTKLKTYWKNWQDCNTAFQWPQANNRYPVSRWLKMNFPVIYN